MYPDVAVEDPPFNIRGRNEEQAHAKRAGDCFSTKNFANEPVRQPLPPIELQDLCAETKRHRWGKAGRARFFAG